MLPGLTPVQVLAEEEAAFSSMLSRGIKEFSSRAEALQVRLV